MSVKGDWDRSAQILGEAARSLEKGGAEFIVICTNTMHKVVPQISRYISIPILHIADATADELEKNGIDNVALLGTKYTMTQDFYKERLTARGISVMVPEGDDIEIVNDVIYNELCLGIVNDESRVKYQKIIGKMKDKGANGVILGCTEIGLLISQKDSVLPVFDTTLIHGQTAAKRSIGE